jgi:hypothetical protein
VISFGREWEIDAIDLRRPANARATAGSAGMRRFHIAILSITAASAAASSSSSSLARCGDAPFCGPRVRGRQPAGP